MNHSNSCVYSLYIAWQSQGLLYKHLCCSLIHLLIHSLSDPLVLKSLWHRHDLMVEDGAFSHKIDYVPIEEYLNRFIGSKVRVILVKGDFYLGVELLVY